MRSFLIHSIFLISLVHVCSTASTPNWAGVYNLDSSCNQAECCCPVEKAIIIKSDDTHFLVTLNVAGAPCAEQLNGSTTASVPIPIPQDKNGFQITTNFLGSNNRFTLSDDSQYIANVNLQYPKCSGMAQRVTSNWLGTFDIDDSCNQNECCCLADQATISKLNDREYLVSAAVAGVPCRAQLNGSTTVQVPLPIPQDKNGFQITTVFLGTNSRFTLTYDNQYIANVNIESPRCSGMGRRAKEAKNAAVSISFSSIIILIGAVLSYMHLL